MKIDIISKLERLERNAKNLRQGKITELEFFERRIAIILSKD